jgi:hypothetical protein
VEPPRSRSQVQQVASSDCRLQHQLHLLDLLDLLGARQISRATPPPPLGSSGLPAAACRVWQPPSPTRSASMAMVALPAAPLSAWAASISLLSELRARKSRGVL